MELQEPAVQSKDALLSVDRSLPPTPKPLILGLEERKRPLRSESVTILANIQSLVDSKLEVNLKNLRTSTPNSTGFHFPPQQKCIVLYTALAGTTRVEAYAQNYSTFENVKY